MQIEDDLMVRGLVGAWWGIAIIVAGFAISEHGVKTTRAQVEAQKELLAEQKKIMEEQLERLMPPRGEDK